MIAATVWTALKSTLKNNPAMSAYMKDVFEGMRFNVAPDELPCIMIEPISNGEVEGDMNQYRRIYFNVNLFAFSSFSIDDFGRTIVGGEDYKGILDIENDIRACLMSSNTLGDNVYDIVFEPTAFDQVEIGKYPVRGLMIPIKILYQQREGA